LKIVCSVQARVGSTRLPGKVLQDLSGRTMLARVIERLRAARKIDEVMIATTIMGKDDQIVDECRRHSVPYWRGDENDVLDRYFQAAKAAKADIIVRATSDCPLIDPEVTDKTIEAFLKTRPDYASNTIIRTYPRGLDTEVISWNALGRAWQEARQPHEREHVTPYIVEHPDEFRHVAVTGDHDYSSYRWTVDTPEDLAFARAVYSRLRSEDVFSWRDVLELLEREPELIDLNRCIAQKSLR